MSFDRADLETLVFLVFSIPTDSYTLPGSSFIELTGSCIEGFGGDVHLELGIPKAFTFCLIFGCDSLHFSHLLQVGASLMMVEQG